MANQTDQSPGSSRDNGRLAIFTSDYKPEYRSEDGGADDGRKQIIFGVVHLCSPSLSVALFPPGWRRGAILSPFAGQKAR